MGVLRGGRTSREFFRPRKAALRIPLRVEKSQCLRVRRHGGCGKDDGIIDANRDGASGLSGQFAGLKGNGARYRPRSSSVLISGFMGSPMVGQKKYLSHCKCSPPVRD